MLIIQGNPFVTNSMEEKLYFFVIIVENFFIIYEVWQLKSQEKLEYLGL